AALSAASYRRLQCSVLRWARSSDVSERSCAATLLRGPVTTAGGRQAASRKPSRKDNHESTKTPKHESQNEELPAFPVFVLSCFPDSLIRFGLSCDAARPSRTCLWSGNSPPACGGQARSRVESPTPPEADAKRLHLACSAVRWIPLHGAGQGRV